MNVSKENTFRALKDETLIVDSWLCRVGWHRWEVWSRPYIPNGGKYNLQDSSCACCGMIRVRKLKDQNGHSV